MGSQIFSKFFQMIPSPFKVLDKLFFSESVLERFSSFEMRNLLISHFFAAGVFFDERVNKKMRWFWIAYDIGSFSVISISSIICFVDLITDDFRVVVLLNIQIGVLIGKYAVLFTIYRYFDRIKKTIEFFTNDCDSSESEILIESFADCISVKKWVIVVGFLFFSSYLAADLFHDFEGGIQKLVTAVLSKSFYIKFFIMWCPFQNEGLKTLLSIFQDIACIPQIHYFYFADILVISIIIEIHNKFAKLRAKLKIRSEYAYRQIQSIDEQMEETMNLSDETLRLNKMQQLEKEKKETIDEFHKDFFGFLERYRKLKRIQLPIKKFLDSCFSIFYCFNLWLVIGLVLVFYDSFSKNIKFEFGSGHFLGIFSAVLVWYMFCRLGDLFSKQDDSFLEEVYSTPWYLFTPEQRKIVLATLTIFQRPTRIKALGYVYLNKDTFPGYLNYIYTYVNYMITFQLKKVY